MKEETFEALERLTALTRRYAGEVSKKKRKTQGEVFGLACLYRDLVEVENWIDETAKEYETVDEVCALCGEKLNNRGEHMKICEELPL